MTHDHGRRETRFFSVTLDYITLGWFDVGFPSFPSFIFKRNNKINFFLFFLSLSLLFLCTNWYSMRMASLLLINKYSKVDVTVTDRPDFQIKKVIHIRVRRIWDWLLTVLWLYQSVCRTFALSRIHEDARVIELFSIFLLLEVLLWNPIQSSAWVSSFCVTFLWY